MHENRLVKHRTLILSRALKKIPDAAARARRVERRVSEIVGAVQKQGDGRALTGDVRPSALTASDGSEASEASISEISPRMSTLRLAANRIAAFHRRQLQKSWRYRDPLGMWLGQRITPLERVGVYVPGGKAVYPSTVLMNVIPAKVAGVREIIMTSPIGNDGAIVLAAARVAGVDRVFRVGGAQAVAALRSCTRIIPSRQDVARENILSPRQTLVSARCYRFDRRPSR